METTTSRWPFVAVTVVIGIVSGLGGIIGAAIGSVQGSVSTAIVLRSVFALVPMLALVAFTAGRWAGSTRTYVVVGVCSYLLMPLTWAGKSLLSQFVAGNNLVTLVIDGVIWTGVVLGVVVLERRRNPRARPRVHEEMEITW